MRSALEVARPPPPTEPPPSSSYSPSLLIIIGIIAFVIILSVSIHLLLRFLSRRRSTLQQLVINRRTSSSSDPDQNDLIRSLPIFTLASSLHALPKSSPDCAVCLSTFRPHDDLRLLPACRHAFHAACVDTWLRSTPSCPLCRSAVSIPLKPPVPTSEQSGSLTRSFRIEIGSVSRRRTEESTPSMHHRGYSLGSSFEYVVEEEVEAVMDRIRTRPEKEAEGPSPPGEEVAEAAGGGGRGWLRDYVDHLASSSFNSLRFSERWSHRFDGGGDSDDAERRRESWDLELEESGISTFYRWLVGA